MGLLSYYWADWRISCLFRTLTIQIEEHKKKWCTESYYQSGVLMTFFQLLVPSTEMIFSIHISANKILTILKLELSPDHKNFYLQWVPVIILEQPLQHVSWTAQISIPLLARVSTTSLSLPCMVPIFRDAICSFNLFCRISHDFDLMGTTPTPVLLLTTPSHKVPVPLFLSTTFTDLLVVSSPFSTHSGLECILLCHRSDGISPFGSVTSQRDI